MEYVLDGRPCDERGDVIEVDRCFRDTARYQSIFSTTPFRYDDAAGLLGLCLPG